MLIRKAFEHKNAAKNKKRVEFRNCVEETKQTIREGMCQAKADLDQTAKRTL